MINRYLLLVVLLFSLVIPAQKSKDTIPQNPSEDEKLKVQDSISKPPINLLGPSKAAFYSAILPGLGQVYNKKYWKVPVVYGLLAGGSYLHIFYTGEFNRFRDAYKRRLAGFTDDEFSDENGMPVIENDGLIRLQQVSRRRKDIWLIVSIGIYALNILDASVDAHLKQFNVDRRLAIKPHFMYDGQISTTQWGLILNYKF